jgi:hypothetical protein
MGVDELVQSVFNVLNLFILPTNHSDIILCEIIFTIWAWAGDVNPTFFHLQSHKLSILLIQDSWLGKPCNKHDYIHRMDICLLQLKIHNILDIPYLPPII